MTHKENNLTQFFTDYLNNNSELNATNITMACYSAINEADSSLNVAEFVFNMRNGFEYIFKVIDNMARELSKNDKMIQVKPENDHYTIPEISKIYSVSQTAVRKACIEGRLPFKKGSGKCQYLVSKSDMETYASHAKFKKNQN